MTEGFQTYSKGYDASIRRDQEPGGYNGVLSFQGEKKHLWVDDIQTGFALSGAAANSFRVRTFFAKNFSQVSLVVRSQFPDQQRYAEVVEFIRHAQVGFGSSMKLEVVDRYKGPDVHQNQKGPSQSIVAEGYVKSIQRVHERFIQAPTMMFEFTVENMIYPVEWADNSDEKVAYLKSWKEIVSDDLLTFDNEKTLTDPKKADNR